MVDGRPFFVQGVAYSPVPIAENAVAASPFGMPSLAGGYSTLWMLTALTTHAMT